LNEEEILRILALIGAVLTIAIVLGFLVLGQTGDYIKSITNNTALQYIGTGVGTWLIDLGFSIRVALTIMALIALVVVYLWYEHIR